MRDNMDATNTASAAPDAGQRGRPGHPGGLGRPGHLVSRLLIAVGIVIALIAVGIVVWPATVGSNAGQPAASVDLPSPLRPPIDVRVSGAGPGNNMLVVTWRLVQPPPIGYRVYRATGHDGAAQLIGSVTAPDIGSFTDGRGLAPGATYAYTVTSFNRRGESAPSAVAVAAVIAPPPTPTPVALLVLPPFKAYPTTASLRQLPPFRVYPTPTPKAGGRSSSPTGTPHSAPRAAPRP